MYRKIMKSYYFKNIRKILSVGFIGLLLLAPSCTKDTTGIDKEQMGSLRFMLDFNGTELSLANTKATEGYDPLEVSTMWIYSVTTDG